MEHTCDVFDNLNFALIKKDWLKLYYNKHAIRTNHPSPTVWMVHLHEEQNVPLWLIVDGSHMNGTVCPTVMAKNTNSYTIQQKIIFLSCV